MPLQKAIKLIIMDAFHGSFKIRLLQIKLADLHCILTFIYCTRS